MRNKYFISIGSNCPKGDVNVAAAISFISTILVECDFSDIYSTPSISVGDNSTYFNAVGCGWSELDTLNMQMKLKEWEISQGRNHSDKSKNVVIDLDLVIANQDVLRPKDFAREYFQIGYKQLLSRC